MKNMKWLLGFLLVAALLLAAGAALADPTDTPPPSVTANDLTYTGADQELVTVDPKGWWVWFATEDNTYVKAIPKGKDATDYTVAWAFIEAQEGDQPEEWEGTGSFGGSEDVEIKPAELTITWTVADSYTYTGENQNPTVAVTGQQGSDEITIEVTDGIGKNKGEYTAVATLDAAEGVLDNYTWDEDSLQQAYTIDPAELTITWTVADSYTYTGENQNPTVAVTGQQHSEEITIEVTDGIGKDASETPYTAVATLNAAEGVLDNYTWEEDSLQQEYTIAPAQLGITWQWDGSTWPTGDITYDAAPHTVTAVATCEGVTGDLPELGVTMDKSPIKNQGDYTATATLTNVTNFVLPDDPTKEFTVGKFQLDAYTWAVDGEQVFEFDYDPAAQYEVTATTNIFETDTDVEVSLSGIPSTWTAGEHTITASLTGDTNGNYTPPTSNTKVITINKVSLADAEIVLLEDEFVFSGQENKPGVASVTLADERVVEPGEYDVSWSNNIEASDTAPTVTVTAEADGNYSGSCETTFIITPKPVTLTWSDREGTDGTGFAYTYNAKNQAPVAAVTTADGLVDGYPCPLVVTPEEAINAGDDYLSEAKLDESVTNYVLDEAAVTEKPFKISPKVVELAWTAEEPYIYNGKEQCPTAEATNLCTGDTCTVTVEPDKKPVHTGKYTAEATELSNSNYALPTANTLPFEIAPLTAELKWADTELVYNTKAQIPTATVTNLVSGDECEVVVKKEETNQGQYTAEATALVNDYNDYALPAVTTQAWTILRKPVKAITITVNGPTEDGKRLGGPDASKYHTITIDAEPDEVMTVTVTEGGSAVATITGFTAGDITIQNDAISGGKLDGSGDTTYTVTAVYEDSDNLTTAAEASADAEAAPSVSAPFVYDTVAKAIEVKPLYNRAAKGVGVSLPEGCRLVKFTSTGAGEDFVATNEKSLEAGDAVIPFDIGENPKLNSTEKGGTFTGEYEDYVGNKGTVSTQNILKASGTIEIVSVEPQINDAGRIGYTGNLVFTVRVNSAGGFSEDASGSVFGTRVLTQGEQEITVAASALQADGTNTPSLAFDDLEGSASFRSFVFDPVCDDPVLTFDPYAGCYYLMGLAEPYSTVALEVNGERTVATADAFGVFALKMPLTEEGDTITLRITDMADNVKSFTYTVGPEAEDVTMSAFMGGKVYTNAHGMKEGKPDWTMILTANVDSLKEGVTVPVYAGNMIIVGTMTVKMDEEGNLSYSYELEDGVELLDEKFIANTKLDVDAFIAQEGIEVSKDGTYIPDVTKNTVYLSAKLTVKVPAEKLKETFQTESVKDSEARKQYRDIQNGRLK